VPDSEPVAPSFKTGQLAVVTDAPSGYEAVGRTPEVGASGEVLFATLRAVAAYVGEPVDVAIFHAVARPTLGNKPPKIAAVRNCHDRLMAELAAAEPRAVLAAGAAACTSLAWVGKATPITKWRGQMRWLELPTGQTVPWVATISPGSVVARADYYRDFVRDIHKVWTQRAPLPMPQLVVIEE
jgi:uracil-DNA glycosylase family 4